MTSLQLLTACLSYSWGGIEKVSVQDALGLAEAGVSTNFLCLENSPIYHSLQALTPHPYLNVSVRKKAPLRYWDPSWLPFLRNWLSQGNLVHLHQPTLLSLFVTALLGKPHPLFLSRHNRNNHSKKNFYHRWLYSRVHRLLVMSESLKQNVLETHAVPAHKITLVRPGLDLTFFNPTDPKHLLQKINLLKEWNLGSQAFVIGCVGRLDPAKGQVTLLKALEGLLQEQLLQEVYVIFVGEETRGAPPGYLAFLQEEARKRSLNNRVRWLGFHHDLPPFLMAFNLFVMPSREEAFGLSAIEAMAMGCPVAISQGGSAQEITQQDTLGWTFPAENSNALKSLLATLINHPAALKTKATLAQRWVRTHYDFRQRIQETIKLYESSLSRPEIFSK